ncbi:MAG: DUF559 domain-containing protein [Dehalococcoidales bacterium]|nr:DUF559 domain-containing protein [Dehalococcoidales bacterium]
MAKESLAWDRLLPRGEGYKKFGFFTSPFRKGGLKVAVTGANNRLGRKEVLPYNKNLKQFSRDLRNTMTDAEIRLWARLKSKQLKGYQFYRQRIIGQHIVDFCCLKTKLVIEVDGSQHYTDEGQRTDRKRDEYLVNLGFTVLRFSDIDILKNIDGAVSMIVQHLGD